VCRKRLRARFVRVSSVWRGSGHYSSHGSARSPASLVPESVSKRNRARAGADGSGDARWGRERARERVKEQKKRRTEERNRKIYALAQQPLRQAVWPFSRLLSPARRGANVSRRERRSLVWPAVLLGPAVIRWKPAGICRALAFTAAFTVAVKSPCATQLAVPGEESVWEAFGYRRHVPLSWLCCITTMRVGRVSPSLSLSLSLSLVWHWASLSSGSVQARVNSSPSEGRAWRS
jgi:hypothetical protein